MVNIISRFVPFLKRKNVHNLLSFFQKNILSKKYLSKKLKDIGQKKIFESADRKIFKVRETKIY